MSEVKSMSVGDWIITMIVTAIPVIGFIMLFVWAFGSGTNLSKQNWAKAALIFFAIAVALYAVFAAALLGALASAY